MAVKGMRELLRDPTRVFAEIEETGEPLLLTNRGRPVAAIYPVDSERAEQLLLATAPEYVGSRRLAENARAEGRTRSLEDAVAEYNVTAEPDERIEVYPTAEPQIHAALANLGATPPASESKPSALMPTAELQAIFGTELAGKVADDAVRRVYAISESMIGSAEEAASQDPSWSTLGDSERRRDVVEQVQGLNAQLFGEVMREVLVETAKERVAVLDADPDEVAMAIGPEGMFDQVLATKTLETTDAYVKEFAALMVSFAPTLMPGALVAAYTAAVVGLVRRLARSSGRAINA